MLCERERERERFDLSYVIKLGEAVTIRSVRKLEKGRECNSLS